MSVAPLTRIRSVRSVQVVLLLLALFVGLQAYEAPRESWESGSESIRMGFTAPVVADRGPWKVGTVLTDADAGIPTDVAPVWEVKVAHEAQGVGVSHVRWIATVALQQINAEGRAWWRIEEPVPIEEGDMTVSLTLDVRALQARAEQMLVDAKVPGRLDVVLRVTHIVSVDRDGVPVDAARGATLTIQPQGDMAIARIDQDTASYIEEASRTWVVWIVALPLAALLLEIPVRRTMRSAGVLDLVRSVHIVPVHSLDVPQGVPVVSMGRLLHIARKSGAPVYQDDERGVLLMRGEVDLASRYPWLPPDWSAAPVEDAADAHTVSDDKVTNAG